MNSAQDAALAWGRAISTYAKHLHPKHLELEYIGPDQTLVQFQRINQSPNKFVAHGPQCLKIINVAIAYIRQDS